MSEKLAAVNAAADRAEAAAKRAEKAAKDASNSQVVEAEVDPEDDGTQNEPSSQNPNSPAFNNTAG